VIACVGDIMVDVFVEQDGRSKAHPGGKACNYAVMAKAMGAAAAVIGCVGDDEHGRAILSELRKSGVDSTHVQLDPVEATGADFFESGTWRMERGANWNLTPAWVRQQLQLLQERGPLSALIVNQGVSATASEEAVLFAREHDILLMLNLAPEAIEPRRMITPARYGDADFVIVNQIEAELLHEQFGLSVDPADSDTLSQALLEATRARIGLVLSKGVRGATIVLRGHETEPAQIRPAVEDVPDLEHFIGAGDVMLAAATVELAACCAVLPDRRALTLEHVRNAFEIGIRAGVASLDYAGTMTGPVTEPARFLRLRQLDPADTTSRLE
jgi:ribokinase